MISFDPHNFNILAIEDNAANLSVIVNCLENFGFTVLVSQDSDSGLRRAKYAHPHLILLDVLLPDRDGYETCRLLKADEATRDIPVIFMTALADTENKVKGLSVGAVDYIAKPFQQEELLARVQIHLQLNQLTQTLEFQNCKLQSEIEQRQQVEAELLNANQELARQRDLAQTTLNAMAEGVIVTDMQGRIETLNPLAEKLTGWNETEARGLSIGEVFQIMDEETRISLNFVVEDAILNGRKIVIPESQTLLSTRASKLLAVDGNVAPILNTNHRAVGSVLVFRDVTQPRDVARKLAWHASYDTLTQLPNRREFEARLTQAIASAQNQDAVHCLCFIDLDRFKLVNDTCGHRAGDELLRQCGALLLHHVRDNDTVARLGGDEFALLLSYCSVDQAVAIGNRICQAIHSFRFIWDDQTFTLGASLGLVPIQPHHSNSIATLLNAADTACYAAKNRGGSQIFVYESEDCEIAQYRSNVHWVAQIDKALTENRFQLFCQGIRSLQSDGAANDHQEILVRMIGEDGALIAPGVFMPAAERYNLMPSLDRWIINTFFSKLHSANRLKRIKQANNAFCFAINLSGASLNDDDFAPFLLKKLAEFEIPPTALCFEITETVAVTNLKQAAQFIRRFKDLGCRFALDDFGCGMSSLAYLKNLPVDYVKIDGFFVKEMIEDPMSLIMVETIHRLACALNIQTIAEFVSSETILEQLRNIGVHYGQGYFIDMPKPFQVETLTSSPLIMA
ncbi:MAG: EAL domain-containing protein [Thermosynechococcaceae cyanobacterium]